MQKINKFINQALSPLGVQLRRRNSLNGFWSSNAGFLDIYNMISPSTLVGIDRCFVIYQYARYAARHLKGDVAELGVYRGGTARLIAECFKNVSNKIFLFDTFSGLPIETKTREPKDFSDVSFDEVKKLLSGYPTVEFRKGFFPETAKDLSENIFSFVYLDADLYTSTIDGLNFFYSRLVPGGIIVIDDYGSPQWPGIKKAAEEFAVTNNVEIFQMAWWQCCIIKAP